MITAAIDICSRSMPNRDIAISANMTVNGTMLAMISAGLRPRNASITMSTTANVCPTFDRAPLIATVTLLS